MPARNETVYWVHRSACSATSEVTQGEAVATTQRQVARWQCSDRTTTSERMTWAT